MKAAHKKVIDLLETTCERKVVNEQFNFVDYIYSHMSLRVMMYENKKLKQHHRLSFNGEQKTISTEALVKVLFKR